MVYQSPRLPATGPSPLCLLAQGEHMILSEPTVTSFQLVFQKRGQRKSTCTPKFPSKTEKLDSRTAALTRPAMTAAAPLAVACPATSPRVSAAPRRHALWGSAMVRPVETAALSTSNSSGDDGMRGGRTWRRRVGGGGGGAEEDGRMEEREDINRRRTGGHEDGRMTEAAAPTTDDDVGTSVKKFRKPRRGASERETPSWVPSSHSPFDEQLRMSRAKRLDTGRGLHASTSQLNLSRVCHKHTPYTP